MQAGLFVSAFPTAAGVLPNYTALLGLHRCELGCAATRFFRCVCFTVLSVNQQSAFEVNLLVFHVCWYLSHSIEVVSGLTEWIRSG